MIGNRVTERDIRDWLEGNGFLGRTAEFEELELHAIRRPGWEQVFRFHVLVSTESGNQRTLYGCVKDDERIRDPERKTLIAVFESEKRRQQQLERWSNGMLTCKAGQTGSVGWTIGIVTAIVTALVLMSRWGASP